jgi:branched-chain amino acid transport system substrate-binding protein
MRLLAVLAAFALIVAACGGDGDATTTTAAAGDTTTTTAPPDDATTTTGEAPMACSGSIGVMAPITGPAASIGVEQLNWAKLAVDQFNEANGTEIALVEGDTQLDPAQASTVAPQFVSDAGILAVVGPAGSQEIEAVGAIFADAGMPFISMSATRTDLTDGQYPTFFRVVPTDADQGPTIANFVAGMGGTKVFIVDDQTSYSTGLTEAIIPVLEAADIEVTTDSVSQDATDFSSLVSNVSDDTDWVILPWQIAANAQLFGQQLAEQGKTAAIFGSDGLFSPNDFTIEGSYVSAFAPDITGIPESADLVEAFQSQYGDFGTFGPPTFAAATIALEAIYSICQAGGEPDRAGVLEAVAATDQATSVLGQPIVFNESGDVEGAVFFIFQIQDGEYVLFTG